MEEETRGKKAIFIGGLAEDVNEAVIYEHFSPFGDIVEVQLPSAATNPAQETDAKHRGFAFVTYSSAADALDAIDNMDLNELHGKVLKVNIAKSVKSTIQPAQGNRAVWESEEWLQQYAKPLAQSGGVQGRNAQREARASGDASQAEEPADPEDQEAMEE
ncbi:RNA-binding domain-containing protein [Pisolithus croceorrhizus]|nr:RNA-binding domain-containing protein [Pisolithus croceorrhizus]KAI6109014.1 RNA-binding domain-containing protein [Pisolithus croceorrhizus]KAI6109777.1 RNA-binding domain-containing protein [Pisolithus sp. B1]